MTKCRVNPVSSRCCERGTKGCEVRHIEATDETMVLRDEIERLVATLKDHIVALCRAIDNIEVIEGVDDLGQLTVGADLTANLLNKRDEALSFLREIYELQEGE